jgi:hypothetical protein
MNLRASAESLDWAATGSDLPETVLDGAPANGSRQEKPPALAGLPNDGRCWARTTASPEGERWRWFERSVTWMGAAGLEPATSSLSSWRSPY